MAPSQEINIPQKPPMVMIDRLVSVNGEETATLLTIREDNIFVDNGLFTEPGLIENMAQTAAAGAGAKPGIEPGNAPVGFIGGIRNLAINRLPATGEELHTTAIVTHEVFDATLVDAAVFCGEEKIASCELKIFIMADNQK